MNHSKTIVVLDGHDAAGKSTLARRLSNELGAGYVEPFAGENGARLLALAVREPDAVTPFARRVLSTATEAATEDVVVVDRHWMTVCSLLPERLWALFAPPLAPPTALCWADLPTTLARLAARDEPEESTAEHARYLRIYEKLGRCHDCMLVRTDRETVEQSVTRLMAWIEPLLHARTRRNDP